MLAGAHVNKGDLEASGGTHGLVGTCSSHGVVMSAVQVRVARLREGVCTAERCAFQL